MEQQKTIDGISEEDYLSGELISEIKHEYVGGQVYAMTGATKNHARISGNIFAHLWNSLKGKPCEAFSTDVKIKTQMGNFRYPDTMVVCDKSFGDSLYTESPVIIIEVLSKPTRQQDKNEKKSEYLKIPSLKEYVLIEQDIVDVEVCRKENDWKSEHYFLGDEIRLASIWFTMSVEDIYERVHNDEMRKFNANRNI